MVNTGNITVTERDMNPLSSTYDTTRTRTYEDLRRCALPAPDMNYKWAYVSTSSDHLTIINCSEDHELRPSMRPYNLRKVMLGECLHTMTSDTFSGITTIREAVIGLQGHTVLGFDGCTGLSTLTIYNGLYAVGRMAFQGCTSLTEVTIPQSVGYIGFRAFRLCTSLTGIYFIGTTPPTLDFEYGRSEAFDSTNNCPIYVPAEAVTAYKSASSWSAYADRIQAIPTP